MPLPKPYADIPGTVVFDADQARMMPNGGRTPKEY
jgi:hypothetical protein